MAESQWASWVTAKQGRDVLEVLTWHAGVDHGSSPAPYQHANVGKGTSEQEPVVSDTTTTRGTLSYQDMEKMAAPRSGHERKRARCDYFTIVLPEQLIGPIDASLLPSLHSAIAFVGSTTA